MERLRVITASIGQHAEVYRKVTPKVLFLP
jgi:hypothetical protein